VVTHQLQVERRTAKERWPETGVLPLSHADHAGRGHVPPGVSRGGGTKRGAVIFETRNNNNSISSVETGTGMERQIMCIDHTSWFKRAIYF